jgi:hypothetical protein
MSENLEQQMQEYTNKYYKKNKKNSLFKTSQKFDCAKEMSNHFSSEKLIQSSIYIIPNSNYIYIDYPQVKQFLCPDNYDNVSRHILTLNQEILKTHPSFNIRVDLKSFTITAAQRYGDLIRKFCSLYLDATEQSTKIEKIQIVNPPSVMKILLKLFAPFISQESLNKVQFITP